MKTYTPKAGEIKRAWHVIDAEGKTLGRLASEAAQLLKGKHKVTYATHLDTGDFVVVVNAEKLELTRKHLETKFYYRHSGYPSGFRKVALRENYALRPAWVIEEAIRGMLPRNRLGAVMARKLKVYAGPDHPHSAQTEQPKEGQV
jgi:large subunit ribosomal protein L13